MATSSQPGISPTVLVRLMDGTVERREARYESAVSVDRMGLTFQYDIALIVPVERPGERLEPLLDGTWIQVYKETRP